jgi:tetraacyldisaccharide 4'-kinase
VLKSFRYLFLPFSLLYGIILYSRNWLFDKKYLKSATFNFPIICVGNLAVGGTGKTPMVEYLIRILGDDYQLATLSRGYKRKTKGFGIANENTTALEIGDEPMQFHLKYPKTTVTVGEERLAAIPELLQERPNTQVIILDDAFQHRTVNAGLNILLTERKNLYSRDFFLPAGDLRDTRHSASRAQIIIVTKCKDALSTQKRDLIISELRPNPNQAIFFTEIVYGKPYHLFSKENFTIIPGMDMLRYPDHHIFSIDDLHEIKNQFDKLKSSNKIILTTEKDSVRLLKFENELKSYPIFVLPIEHHFLFNDAERFYGLVKEYVDSFPKIR